jgi:diphthamide biosynthesis protein 2
MKELIKAAGKKSYTLVMGRPNSAKLANFPEVHYIVMICIYLFSCLFQFTLQQTLNLFSFWQCEVFVYVSCSQTALLDSKEFLAPVITPFEAVLAFSRYVVLADCNSILEMLRFLIA